jgi:hypothetical protein
MVSCDPSALGRLSAEFGDNLSADRVSNKVDGFPVTDWFVFAFGFVCRPDLKQGELCDATAYTFECMDCRRGFEPRGWRDGAAGSIARPIAGRLPGSFAAADGTDSDDSGSASAEAIAVGGGHGDRSSTAAYVDRTGSFLLFQLSFA